MTLQRPIKNIPRDGNWTTTISQTWVLTTCSKQVGFGMCCERPAVLLPTTDQKRKLTRCNALQKTQYGVLQSEIRFRGWLFHPRRLQTLCLFVDDAEYVFLVDGSLPKQHMPMLSRSGGKRVKHGAGYYRLTSRWHVSVKSVPIGAQSRCYLQATAKDIHRLVIHTGTSGKNRSTIGPRCRAYHVCGALFASEKYFPSICTCTHNADNTIIIIESAGNPLPSGSHTNPRTHEKLP
jgi:hypothetical protein